LLTHCFVPGVHTPAQTPLTHAWLVHAAPSCHDPLASHVCTTGPLHCFVPGVHVPAQAPPLQTVAQVVFAVHTPVALQVSGEKPLHCLVPGAHPPRQTPAVQTYGQVSTRVVVTRSRPHLMLSVPWQSSVPPGTPPQFGAIGWQDPALPPGVVSQLLLPAQVPFGDHLPPAQMSCPF
jgi:hypothetical protein